MSDHALTVFQQPQAFTLVPTSLGEAMEFARLMSESDFVSKDFRGKAANVLMAVQLGAEVGLSPMQALQNIAVINGKPAIWGDAMLAVVQKSRLYEWHKEVLEGEGENQVAHCTVKRVGLEPKTATFSVADARRAGLWTKEGPWKTYPQRMLQMRARAWALRDQFADVLKGLQSREEVEDFAGAEPIKNVTPTEDPAFTELPKEMQEKLTKAFDALNLSPAQRRVQLAAHKGREDELLEKFRDEYAKRKGRKRTAKPKAIEAKPAETAEAKPAEGAEAKPAEAKPEEIVNTETGEVIEMTPELIAENNRLDAEIAGEGA